MYDSTAWGRKKLNYLDLFAGVGGFRLGLERAGFKWGWTGHSEIDKAAGAIYHEHWPESEALGDVREIKAKGLPKVDLVTFGFPCQDLSVAGKRRGLYAKRSVLFFEAMRIVRATRPTVFIFENVKGLLTSRGGEDFDTVLREVADLGLYDCEWQVINSLGFLPQNRERVYFIGHLRGKSGPRVFPIPDPCQGKAQEQVRAISARRIRSIWRVQMSHKSRRAILRGRRLRFFTQTEYARLQGFPDDWFEGYSQSVAQRCAGNAVSVPVVQAIGERLRRA